MTNSFRIGCRLLLFVTSLSIAACGGGGGGAGTTSPQKVTPTVTVQPASSSITTAQSLAVSVAVSGGSTTPTGSVTLSSGSYTSAATPLASGSASITIPASSLAAGSDSLSATYTPDATGSTSFNSGSGSASVTVKALILPAVTVTPASSSITTAQPLNVTIAVSGGSGNPLSTGTVILSGGGYTSAATVLSNGGALLAIPAGALSTGPVTLTASYTPDTNGALTYLSATGSAALTVNSLVTPTIVVSPGSGSITTAQSLSVTITVSGSGPAPTGSVVLSSGSYTSSATALLSGSAIITIPAHTLAAGSDLLTAAYTPDSTSSSIYTSAHGTGPVTVTSTYTLTVDSAGVSSGISISASPADNSTLSGGSTPFTLTYNAGTQVTLTAALSASGAPFASWSGCTTANSGTCNVTLDGNTTVTATYTVPATVTSISVSPNTATIGTQQTFTATVNGTGSYSKSVTWTVAGPTGSTLSPGTIATSGTSSAAYNTPYPAPATVTITATSVQTPSISGSVTVTLNGPATAAGPALSIDVGTPSNPNENPHTINPYIYGVNAFDLDSASAKTINPAVVRWGGDDTSRYNYQNNITNSASDYYFENFQGAADMFPNSSGFTSFTQLVQADQGINAATLGTVPVNGWVSNGTQYACSFTQTQFPNQQAFESGCGTGVLSTGADLNGNSGTSPTQIPLITSIQETPPSITTAPAPGSVTSTWAASTWSGGWVSSIVNNSSFGNGASGNGVALWDLDNEPTWWDAVHRDVHPSPFTYDEVTNNDLGTALAIKTADPTALVDGPVIDYWPTYFYSKQDYENGLSSTTGHCPGSYWNAPADRTAHGGTAMIPYFLQQFNSYSQQYGVRLLDYLDIHGYLEPEYNGSSVGLTTAGDTQVQITRMNGTRVFWDPTYTDPNYLAPNYAAGGSSNCSPSPQAPELIPMLQAWVNGTAPLGDPSNNYPGTKTAIDEYNFGGLESINGAVVQADILGIFGRQGLDLGAFWPTELYSQQTPGNYAFAMYRNYDGNDSMFGNTYLYATSAATGGGDGEGQLAVYAAQRSTDNSITVMVINKSYGALSSTISLENFAPSSSVTAQVFQYSNANLNAIQPQPAVAVTPPASGTTSTIGNYTFPAQSITLFVIPQ